jgi:hypothetical protein
MSSKAKGIEEIEKIEKIVKVKTISLVMVVVLIIALVYLFRPDLPKTVSDKVINGTKTVAARIQSEFNRTRKEEKPAFKEFPTSQPAQQPQGTVLEIGSRHSFRGNTFLLTMVNDRGTYCRISVNGNIHVITNETSRSISGVRIQVLEANPPPVETCRVLFS